MTIAGEGALHVYNTDADEVDPEAGDYIKQTSLVQKFENYCTPRKNETYKRYVFCSTVQSPLEPIDCFITDLKTKVKSCNFSTLENSLVQHQIIIGVHDVKLKERLLREPDFNFGKS